MAWPPDGDVRVLAGLAELLAAVVVTVAGLLAELNAAGFLAGGETMVGLWLAYVGAIALYAGLFVVGGGLPQAMAGLLGRDTRDAR